MSLKESQFQKQVKRKLDKIENCWYFVKEAKSIRGIPDIVGVYNGVFFGWELKRSEREASKLTGRIVLQRYILSLIRHCGGVGEIVHPDNLDQKLKDLQEKCSPTLLH
jgi:hypothetical protein